MPEDVIDAPDTDVLAGEYVLGTLDPEERAAAHNLISADAAFADPAGHPAPDADALAQLNARFTQAMGETLAGQGFDAQKFSFVSTSFNADGTGADHILDNISVSTDHGRMLLNDQLAGHQIEVSLDAQMPALKVSTLAHEGTGSSKSSI